MSFSSVSEDDTNEPDVDAIVSFIGHNRVQISEENNATTSNGYTNYRVAQYAVGVIDFSSQYGIDYSISYTAPNIIGRPMKFPAYGDYPETFAMRTYGDWWSKVPSRTYEIQAQNMPKVVSHDFIVICFEDYLLPNEVAIYETFNPGAVVRIWAYTIASTWICLWESQNFNTSPPYNFTRSRRFAPPIKKLSLPTKTLRIEFNHTFLNYYTEIDGVLLSGNVVNAHHIQQLMKQYWDQQRKGTIMRKLRSIQFRPIYQSNYELQLQEFFNNDLSKFLKEAQVNSQSTNVSNVEKEEGHKVQLNLVDLPFEILLSIFSYLDLMSLFRVGQVSHVLYDISTHPLLYCELNLKPYWHTANSELLCTLARRATMLRKLDLSWCGLFSAISSTEFKKFITQRGDNLTHLRLNSCKFLNASCIETLGIVCDNLIELTLRNCASDQPLLNFSCLANLKNLERLDLFQTAFESELLLAMLESNRKLKHLNLAFCGISVNMDNIAEHIGTYNKQLISLDMWKSHFLSARGLYSLASCTELEELDLGWCLREATLGESLYTLLSKCHKIKKLFLSTVRGITERDLSHIANLCKNLEQLDLMGTLSITRERIYEILVKCPKLQLLDLSFCDNVMEGDLPLFSQWSRGFQVQIKCSHVPYVSR